MRKSLIDVLWEELKIEFYYKNRDNKDVHDLWSKYQIELIHRTNK